MLVKRKPRYFTDVELCEVFDITLAAFRNNIRPNIPIEAIDKTKPPTYHGRTTIEVYCAHRQKRSHKLKGVVDDPSVKSLSARENLIDEQFRIARMRRRTMQQELISTKKVRESLNRLEVHLKDLGEQFKRSGNPKALELLNETLDKYGREMTDLWASAWKKGQSK